MTDVITGLILVAMVMTPGVPGEFIYGEIVGEDWREDRINYVVRVVLIGMVGLALTILVFSLLGGPAYGYMENAPPSLESDLAPPEGWMLGTAYLTHLVVSALVGWVSGKTHRRFAEEGDGTIHPYAWDDLVNTHAPDHWVVIVTTEGSTYAGKIETADDYVGPNERDILIEEPARYDKERDGYFATEYQHLFFPANLIESVAVVSEEDDERLAKIGQKVL